MSKILIAFFMGLHAGGHSYTQIPDHDNLLGTEVRSGQREDCEPFPGLDCVQPVGSDFTNKQIQKGKTDDRPID